jgi:predicted O-linked N-acetylglucosamine transferase (SPINDLY family)
VQRQQMAQSPLCDARDLAAQLELAYFRMFEQWWAKQHNRGAV